MNAVEPARANAVLVDALSSALRRGGNALGSVPDLLKRVLEEESWRHFTTQRGEDVRHNRFAAFVTTPPLQGLGADIDLVRRIVRDDKAALDLLDRAVQNPVGRPSETLDNVQDFPSGNSEAAALRRLRKDAPELHARVLADELSAHAAMVQAGYRPKTFTVRATDPDSIARTLKRHMHPDDLRSLAELLLREANPDE